MSRQRRSVRAWALGAVGAFSMSMAAGGLVAACARAEPPQRAAPATPVAQKRMNVLLIIADDMNTQLGAYGAPVKTPNIDRLAGQGVRFDQAYVQYPVCGASRASFLTGLRPDTVGREVIYEVFRCSLPDTVTLPQQFMQNGYFAGRVGKAYHQGVPSDIGTAGPDDAASWTAVVNPRGLDKDIERDVINMTPGLGLGRANAYLAVDAPDEALTDGKVANEAIAMIKAQKGKPFFITAGFYRPHVPEIAPKRYFDLYDPAKIQLARETAATLAAVPAIAKNSDTPNLGMTEAQQRAMIHAYYASTSFMDAQVGRLLKALKDEGLEDDTIVVFIGDHGFMLGEHGQWQKSMLFEGSVRAPMIIRAPGMAQGVVRKPVEFLDLYPTLTELAGVPHNPTNQGKSLSLLLRNPAAPGWTKPAFSQIYGGRSVRTDRYRYTEWEGGKSGRELYDYRSDPLEHRNLADDPRHAGLVKRLAALLPQGEIEPRGMKTLNNPQGPPPRRGSRPPMDGCNNLQALEG